MYFGIAVLILLLLGALSVVSPKIRRERELREWNRPQRELCRRHPRVILDSGRRCSECRRDAIGAWGT